MYVFQDVFFGIFFFIFGSIIGSFLNVVALRYNTGWGVGGRSCCFSCGKTLKWYELFPIFSFVIQLGRCRGCGAKLSWQYPLGELLTACLFFGLYVKYATLLEINIGLFVVNMLFYCIVWSILVVILIYDIRHKIIPDGLVYSFAILVLIKFLISTPLSLILKSPFLFTLLAGPILFLPFFLLWFVSGGRWIGLGDGKLALGMGWMLGLGLGTSAIVLAFWIGAVISILLMAIDALASFPTFHKLRSRLGLKHLTLKSEIPFAPYLILGTALVFFLGIDVVSLHRLFGL